MVPKSKHEIIDNPEVILYFILNNFYAQLSLCILNHQRCAVIFGTQSLGLGSISDFGLLLNLYYSFTMFSFCKPFLMHAITVFGPLSLE
jgi:hypothetical protein